MALEFITISCRNGKIYLFVNLKKYCHWQMWFFLPFEGTHSIETNLQTCNWPVHKLKVCKVVSIERVSQMTGQTVKTFTVANARKSFYVSKSIYFPISIFVIREEMAIKSLQTKSVENLLKIGSQLLWAIQRCYIPSCQSRKTREHVFFLSSVLIVQVSPFLLKLWNQVPTLDHLVIQNSGDFLCWKYK